MLKAFREKIINMMQDCHLNFLIGSGLSYPYFMTLGNIENLLTELDAITSLGDGAKQLAKASLYKKYFEGVISKNLNILSAKEVIEPLTNYKEFLKNINIILLERDNPLLGKEANIFTTNVDIFLEKALEELGVEYNDGFHGRFQPVFSLSNFKKTHFKRSLHYENKSELPVFNLLKLHGSISWKLQDEKILFSPKLSQVQQIKDLTAQTSGLTEIKKGSTIESIIENTKTIDQNESVKTFLDAYENLLIVNPTKEKFKHTLLNQTYYEMLRIYSNELEKENSILLVMGFSFADEHIREITIRAANSNPTLMIYVFAYDAKAKTELQARLMNPRNIKHKNIEIIAPGQEPSETEMDGSTKTNESHYNFEKINEKIFSQLLTSDSSKKI